MDRAGVRDDSRLLARSNRDSAHHQGVDFYDLPTDKQDAVYREATDGWADAMASQADYLNDRKCSGV